MIRFVFLALLFSRFLAADLIKSEILWVKEDKAAIHIENIQKGVSGFVVHTLAPNRSAIVNGAVIEDFNQTTKIATLKLTPFTMFRNNNLPSLKLQAQKGDLAVLAFGYDRALVIAPSEDIYYRLTQAMRGEVFIHPDIFATMLSWRGHPTPLQKDFQDFCQNVSIGLVFFYIERKLYTVDCNSFTILGVQEAPLEAKEKRKLPFYTRIEKIEASWFGAGSDELEDYAPYYYRLLYENNPNNTVLIDAIRHSKDTNVTKEIHLKD